MKGIWIKSCADCPYLSAGRCTRARRIVWLAGSGEIPDWCPLPPIPPRMRRVAVHSALALPDDERPPDPVSGPAVGNLW